MRTHSAGREAEPIAEQASVLDAHASTSDTFAAQVAAKGFDEQSIWMTDVTVARGCAHVAPTSDCVLALYQPHTRAYSSADSADSALDESTPEPLEQPSAKTAHAAPRTRIS